MSANKLTSKIPLHLKCLATQYTGLSLRKKIHPVDVFLALVQTIFCEANEIVIPDDWRAIEGLNLKLLPSSKPGLFRTPAG